MDIKRNHAIVFFSILLVLIALVFVISNLYFQTSSGVVQIFPRNATESSRQVTDANNRFALDLYSNITKNPGMENRNVFFSPLSISSSMVVAYEGARGETADEIRGVFYFPKDKETLRQGYNTVLNDGGKDSQGNIFSIVNALWVEKSSPLSSEYAGMARKEYMANLTILDFNSNPEGSRQTINTWVESETKGKIHSMIPERGIDSSTSLVITNAIYFSGSWVHPFDRGSTYDSNFSVNPDQTVRVAMMRNHGPESSFGYMDTEKSNTNMTMRLIGAFTGKFTDVNPDSFQMIELPYQHVSGKNLSMLVILPMNNITLVENSLTPEKLNQSRNELVPIRIEVYMPRFIFETQSDLTNTLSRMGMRTSFSPSADFSGIDGTKGLYISKDFHNTFIDVNEEGTTAAAATSIVVTQGLEPRFIADHPFIFIIQERETGNIIFMGRVIDPNN